MASMHIDTLSIARDLKAAKLPAAQAEAIASAIGISIVDVAATKSDLRELKLELEAKIEAVQSRLIMWLIASQTTFAAIIIAAVKL